MARAEILFEDNEDGTLAVRYVFPAGFDVKSGAHQLVNMVRKHLDITMVQAGEIEQKGPTVDFGDMEACNAVIAADKAADAAVGAAGHA